MKLSEDMLKAAQGIEYPPNLYRCNRAAEVVDGGFEAVTDEHVQWFHEHGYLILRHAFGEEEVQQALTNLLFLMDGHCTNFRGAQIEPKLAGHVSKNSLEEKQDAI